jgi:hypothetical protein
MQLRNACQDDQSAIPELYQRVASVPGGLAAGLSLFGKCIGSNQHRFIRLSGA